MFLTTVHLLKYTSGHVNVMLKFKVLLDKRQIVSYFNSAFLYRIMIIIDFSFLSSFIYHMERSINKSLSGPVYLQEKKIIQEKEVTYKITCLTLITSELPYPVCSCKKSKQYSSCFLINAPFFNDDFFMLPIKSRILGARKLARRCSDSSNKYKSGFKKRTYQIQKQRNLDTLRRQCPAVIWALVSWRLYPA